VLRTRKILAFAAVATFAAACGSKAARKDSWFGDQHDRAAGDRAEEERRIPALEAEEARRRLRIALDAESDFDAIVYANRLIAAGGKLEAEHAERLWAAVDRLSSDELERIWKELDPSSPAEIVAMRRALLEEHRGEDERALEWLGRVKGNEAVEGRARALKARIESRREVDPGVIAVLLPLSGRFARVGAEIRAAIELAGRRDQDGRLEFLDTEGDAVAAVIAVDRAVHELHAVGILGPVGDRESRSAAARATELGVPIALLSPGHDGAAPEVGVFRLLSSPIWEAREAVRLAMHMGYDRLAVLAPRDELGEAQIEAFRTAVARAGARLVAAGTYDPTATDLEPDMKAFLGLDPKTNARLRRHLQRRGYKKGWKTFSPAVEFDLLFIPDEYQRAALVAAYLPFFNVEVRSQDVMDIIGLKRKHGGRVPQVVQLLGSSGWHHESLIPRGGSVLEGALILDVFAGGENEEFASETGAAFSEAFERRYGHLPGPLAAQAYDAALLVLSARIRAAQRRALSAREAFLRALRGTQVEDGACGPAAVDRTGEVVREAILLRVDGGVFVRHEY